MCKRYPHTWNDETWKRLYENVNKLSGKKANFYIFKYSFEADPSPVMIENFKILNTGYRYKRLKTKVSESLFIIHNEPFLNKQVTSVYLNISKISKFCFKLNENGFPRVSFIVASVPFGYGIT